MIFLSVALLVSPVFAEPVDRAPNSADGLASTSDSRSPDSVSQSSEDRDTSASESTADKPTQNADDILALDAPHIPPPGTRSYLQFDANVQTDFVVGSEFGGTKANSSDTRFVLEAGGPLSRVASMGVRVRFGVRDFAFDGEGQFIDAGQGTGEPFDALFEYSMSMGARIRLTDGLGLEISGRGISRIEEGASFGSGLEGGGGLSLLGRYEDWVVLRLGVAVRSDFEDSGVQVSPVFRLRLRLHDRLWAETGGRNGRLEFTLTDRVRIDLFGGVEGGRYRLDSRRDGIGGVGEGSIHLSQTDVGLATRLTLRPGLRIHLEAGVILTQALEIQDENGDSFDERENRDPAFRGRASVKWRF